MKLVELLLLYGLVGLACGGAILRASPPPRARSLWSAAIAVPLWPLWGPIALGVRPAPSPETPAVVLRLRQLWAELATADTPIAGLVPRELAERIELHAERTVARVVDLELLLRSSIEAGNIGAPGHLHNASLERLAAIRDRDARTVEELGELADHLRSQLLLLRHGAASKNATDAVLLELRVLTEALEAIVAEGPPSENP